MKQVLQSLKSGTTEVADVPCPSVSSGQLLIRTHSTLISTGTEKMLVDFAKANLLNKVRQQPEKVSLVLNKIKTDGLMPTLDSVFNKLDQSIPLGYCNVGEVCEMGNKVANFTIGDRVVSNGKHAEMVSVPMNLCARIPENVSDDEAAFTVIGAIGLQGIRLAQPTLGECVVVTGLGLIGLITVQLLKAHGCRVLGIDFDPAKLEMARKFGAEIVDLSAGEDPIAAAEKFSRGRGIDAVLITASTKSNLPVHQAALMCRKRGRIVLIGVIGLELSRADFYEKELTFQVSCSYGPGRYDPNYEEKGFDYPAAFVRWTEQRNFEAVLDMISNGTLDMKSLISHRFVIDEAAEVYDMITKGVPSLGILLEYPKNALNDIQEVKRQTVYFPKQQQKSMAGNKVNIGFVGSGNYASGVLIPAFKKTNAQLKIIASATGLSGFHIGRKYGFDATTTDTEIIFDDPEINTVVISTRHDSHFNFVAKALGAERNVFVEKPLALTIKEVDALENTMLLLAQQNKYPVLMVGFNRRFSPQVQKIYALLQGNHAPKSFIMTVNAGAIPADHWTQDKQVGGGRLIGEACHFIDLLRFLAGSKIMDSNLSTMDERTKDTVTIQLRFENGSIGTIHYFANGSKTFPKERLEVFCGGKVLQLDNFRKLKGFGWSNFNKMNLWRQDKGQTACAESFVSSIEKGTPSPIPIEEIFEVARITIDIANKQC
jgi:predicted dehydrogenase/threonine dehydrogenase-like Zn-dependent dehydrogenase